MTSLLQQLHALATTGFIVAAYLVFFSAENYRFNAGTNYGFYLCVFF